MVDIDQFITIFIGEHTEELEKFKNYIKNTAFPDRQNSYEEWKAIYYTWAIRNEDSEAISMPRILLAED